jgi:tetratricopeptide (TPR) repeat protein
MSDHLAGAAEALAAGDLAQAERRCRAALSVRPQDPEALGLLGIILLRAGRPAAALPALDAAIAGDPGAAPLHDLRGDALEALGRPDDAIAAWRTAVALDPGCVPSLVSLAAALATRGDAAAAVPLLQRATALADGPPAAPIWFNLSNALLALGRDAEADRAWQQARRLDPENPAFAAALARRRRAAADPAGPAAALQALEQQLRQRPDDPALLEATGHARLAVGEPAAAADAFRAVLRAMPDSAVAHYHLGCALLAAGAAQDAAGSLHQAIRRDPARVPAHHSLGRALRSLGRAREAIDAFEAARRLDPARPELLFDLARMQLENHCPAECLATLDELLAILPDHPTAHAQRGQAFEALGRHDDALSAYRTALRLRPADPVVRGKLCALLLHVGGFAEAETLLADGPDDAAFNGMRGVLLAATGRHDAAIGAYTRALELDPGFDDARFGRGEVLLVTGRFAEGWPGYAVRQSGRKLAALATRPAWDGAAAPGRTLLVLHDQGFGDTIQMCRYLPMAAARTGAVVLRVPKTLLRLMATLPGPITLADEDAPLPPHDLACAVMDLPMLFGTTLQTIPAPVPYLQADPAATGAWRARLAGLPRPHIGLAWAGNRGYVDDLRRSIDPALLAPLAGVPGSFVSLQLPRLAESPPFPLTDWTGEITDFADTAALVAALDLVISVDTSVVHLAGALGRPVWLLNRFDTVWRWLLGRADSPWYPTMRIFRQPAPGDWAAVVADVGAALTALARP